MRESVRKGEHKYLPASGRAQMIDEMMKGSCGDDDEDCILKVMWFSLHNGDLTSVVDLIPGDGKDRILYNLDGDQDTEARSILMRGGLIY